MNKRFLLRIVSVLVLAGMLGGCGIIDYYFLPTPEDTAQELFEAGTDAMQDKEYSSAVDYFTKLKDRYPFSPYTPQAELSLGDAYFLDEQYQPAMSAYKEFEALHPGHEEIAYVLFQIGVSGYNSFEGIDLPQTSVAEALEYFRRVIETYPDSEYAAQSSDYVTKCRLHLAEHELFVARFYWRSSQFGAAWKRYSAIAEQFPDLPKVQAYAQKMQEIAYYEHQRTIASDERDEKHGSWTQWFDWL